MLYHKIDLPVRVRVMVLYRGGIFFGGGNRSTLRKPPTCSRSLTNYYHIMLVVTGTNCIRNYNN
jgi:hypothetical protein